MAAAIPHTMQAARYHGPGPTLHLESVPVPTPGPTDVLVRVTHAGACRTELHFLSGLLNLGIAPLTLGHEIVGEVVQTGAAVADYQPGNRVIVNYYGTCGRCQWCRLGQQNLCDRVVAQLGFTADGGYAEFVKARSDMLRQAPATTRQCPGLYAGMQCNNGAARCTAHRASAAWRYGAHLRGWRCRLCAAPGVQTERGSRPGGRTL